VRRAQASWLAPGKAIRYGIYAMQQNGVAKWSDRIVGRGPGVLRIALI